jgi:hypothetical protein
VSTMCQYTLFADTTAVLLSTPHCTYIPFMRARKSVATYEVRTVSMAAHACTHRYASLCMCVCTAVCMCACVRACMEVCITSMCAFSYLV